MWNRFLSDASICTDTRKLSWPPRVNVGHVNLRSRSCSGGGFRFNLTSTLSCPFRLSLPFNHHLSYLVGILLYHCLPRGHGGWTTWDLPSQVCLNNIGVPDVYVLRLALILDGIKCDVLPWNHNTPLDTLIFPLFDAIHTASHRLIKRLRKDGVPIMSSFWIIITPLITSSTCWL